VFESITRRRRRSTLAVKIFVGVLIALSVAALLYFLALRDERIRQFDVEVAVQADGSALVRETIKYDFGSADRHGLRRTFPGYQIDSPGSITDVSVSSASAPVDVQNLGDELRIGDPNETISGRHTYRIEYRLPDAVKGTRLAVDVIGTAWEVPIDQADITVRAPAQLSGVKCVRGQEFADDSCGRLDVAGDVIGVHAEDLDAGEGVSVFASTGKLGDSAELPTAGELPEGDGNWWLWRILLVLGVGAAGYALGLIPVARWARRAGRDYAYHGGGGAVDAVFGGPELETRPIDDEVADEQVTVQFVPPRDLTPAQGGVLLHERVTDDHRVAWLTQQSIDGWFELADKGKTLKWTAPDDRWASAPVPLQRIFAGRHTVKLTRYDKKFASGWKLIDDELEQWRKACGLWDAETEARSRQVQGKIGVVGTVAAAVGAVALYFLAPYSLVLAAVVAGVSGLLVGAGVSSSLNAPELRVRTAPGFAQRQLVAGFLRFFQQSETSHAKQAAERGELRLYSAWAVALGELAAWQDTMAAAALPPSTPGVSEVGHYAAFSTAVHTANTEPAPASSGGSSGSSFSSGGGSVGGGAGGGGGGSW
jgi:hypothetical protein